MRPTDKRDRPMHGCLHAHPIGGPLGVPCDYVGASPGGLPVGEATPSHRANTRAAGIRSGQIRYIPVWAPETIGTRPLHPNLEVRPLALVPLKARLYRLTVHLAGPPHAT